MTAKYVKTNNNQIIVFSEALTHYEFRKFQPVSAGFISFGIDKGEPSCQCYGESISLKLKSSPMDTDLANRQILGSI